MKNLSITITALLLFALSSCNSPKKEKGTTALKAEKIKVVNQKGYELMKTNCFACHMAKPDPSKRGQMIAPPMLRVQEHYKPSYPNKEEFVTAIKTWVKNPSEDKVMMPGAVRKFNLMPKIEIKDEDLQLIAATLYDVDFGNMPKMHQKKDTKLTLNDGKKWHLNVDSKKTIATINKQLSSFKSDKIANYNQLGKDVFANAKQILLDKTYEDKTFGQIQNFFHNIEGNMHNLIASKSLDNAKSEQQILIKKFNQFNNFFE